MASSQILITLRKETERERERERERRRRREEPADPEPRLELEAKEMKRREKKWESGIREKKWESGIRERERERGKSKRGKNCSHHYINNKSSLSLSLWYFLVERDFESQFVEWEKCGCKPKQLLVTKRERERERKRGRERENEMWHSSERTESSLQKIWSLISFHSLPHSFDSNSPLLSLPPSPSLSLFGHTILVSSWYCLFCHHCHYHLPTVLRFERGRQTEREREGGRQTERERERERKQLN